MASEIQDRCSSTALLQVQTSGTSRVGPSRTEISIYCIYAVYDRTYAIYDRIYAVFPYILYTVYEGKSDSLRIKSYRGNFTAFEELSTHNPIFYTQKMNG
jgi:hypothetical protein